MVEGSSIYRCWNGPMRMHGRFICVRIGAEISNWACRRRSDAYAWLHGMRTHRLLQWPSRFCCDLSVLFALSGDFRSELCLLYPETLKYTHQGIEEPLHILDYLAVWQKGAHNAEFNSHRCRCCLEFVIQPPTPKSTRCHRYNPAVTRTSCA
ncbi:hypothetical protein PIB30_061786 [Stylosanthes scabra]|uniref:Uncharacterized protein n=1 Tax=Stylosanthes scabra TaxID=79078 RepID=A0ABU6RL33_9FABA|nr:hypothetical protein [Stylosanthes scabra]